MPACTLIPDPCLSCLLHLTPAYHHGMLAGEESASQNLRKACDDLREVCIHVRSTLQRSLEEYNSKQ